ncbi:hypothetical protein BV25DRAFT_1988543 [Artomyces pyxidatus]|uniref:Uncharacterized protein n=1 Tax=Artomyces pyxidatus TaxID=48021 RepID=A0ACB8TC46_9AGAM|nr:hypothetical protein BV25DRAFT_1988543 [Artomyces pyxidatus]
MATSPQSPATLPTTTDIAPVPLSFPAVLRNPGLTTRFAHLSLNGQSARRPVSAPVTPKKVSRRDENEGKRWVRRKENARFTGNPHIAAPSKRDLDPARPNALATFPIPLPPYLPRTVPLPGATLPESDAQAASAGRFGLSLRGMRKNLRKAGPRTQALVRGVEDELASWLREVRVVASPDEQTGDTFDFPGQVVAGQDGVREVQRTPGRLVWWIEDDAWARYVVHCCARYHEVVSYSKDTPTHRLTYILRPNVARPDPTTLTALATPPATDLDLSSLSYDSDLISLSDVHSSDALSDIISESDMPSDVEHALPSHLSDIASDVEADSERGSVASLYRAVVQEADAWSADGDSEVEASRPVRGAAYRARVWDRARSGSSPSRSPARRMPRRRGEAAAVLKIDGDLRAVTTTWTSLYDPRES